ncbi:SusC/RagA family TonB-linked outer membrane protein [Pedobacter sp. L105]|uniref:SusC/RagA family TonB-linked outer membrane protein n=1 Tax=Pedobacter sp. L105 TaxID=1641871 RepID=UPI0020B15F2A|nr:SusC/RagA family TonB-linked outer membrane protein [Pedobacter sp. L105]
MKLTTLLLITVILQVSAKTLAQKVTLSERNAPLVDVFNQIQKQTGYDFAFTVSTLKDAKPVNIDVKNVELSEVLKKVFDGQPLDYSIESKSVVVSKKEPSLLYDLKNKAVKLLNLSADINGRILDSLGQPLIGASVSLKNTKYYTLTDNKGNFNFSSVPQGKYTLVVTFIGFDKIEKDIEAKGEKITLGLVVHGSTSSLDQVQVIAYGTQSKRFSVGSVATVTAEEIEKQPVTNVLQALQGQVAGLAINSSSGVPGSQVLVQVRGQNTLSSNINNFKPYDQPLFIIDGVPFAPQNSNISQLGNLADAQSSTGGISQGGGISPFNNINPNDIESISILKDADATSIYGTQGSNGVILITTKRGKAGKTTLDFNVNTGFNSNAQPLTFLNTQQYLQLRKDAYAADGVTPTNDPNDYLGYAPDLKIFDQNKYTDWQKVITGKTSSNTDVHASVSGGTTDQTFLISAGYSRSDYNFPGDFSDKRFTLHSALHSNSRDKRFNIDLVNDFGYDQNNSPTFGGSQDILLAPNLPDLRDPAGNLIWNYKGADLGSYQFYSTLIQPANLQNYNYNSSLHLSYNLLKGLTVSANLGYSRNTTAEHSEDPSTAQDPMYAVNPNAAFGNTAAQTINIEPQINYTKTIGKGVFSALLGSTYKKNTSTSTLTAGYGYSNDNFLGSINGAATNYASDNSSIYRYSAAFARLNYIYDQKYIISLTGRRDGSSNFGPTHQFGNFGSAGAGWIFSEEKAFKNALPFFSYGKLSGSYGTSGSDGIQAYQYQSLYNPINNVPAFQGTKPSAPANLYNPDYSWALKKSLNVSLDFGLFTNRLLLNATYYRDREGSQLVGYQLPYQTGFSSVLGNLNANIQNKGYEFSATSTNIKTRDFSWTTRFNLSFNRNKLLSFPDLATSAYSDEYILGQPTSVLYGFRYKDVNPATGLFEFYDKNGNVTSNPTYGSAANGGDQVPIANREVNYMGGIGNNFTYKQFSLYVFCQFSSQNAPNYLYEAYSVNSPGLIGNEPLPIFNNYWKNPGDNATLQRLTSSFNSSALTSAQDFAQSNAVYSNDRYLRLKTVSLSYALPDVFLKKVHVQGANVYVNAQNLLTFTNYKFGDPEQPGSYSSFPLQRIIALGLNVKF